MGKSQESYNKKEVRKKKDKKRKDKEKKRLEKKENENKSSFDDMIAYVDENGNLSDTPPDPDEKEEINAEDIEVSISKKEESEEDTIRKGVVSFFNDDKGFGFIRDMENNQSIFVHANNLYEEIKENNIVTFEVEYGPRGPAALNVKIHRKEE